MPIDSTHPSYPYFKKQWDRCRDTTNGSDAVKAKGNKYLPRLGGQDNDDYNAYKQRALFFSVAGRSMVGLVGMATRRTPKVEASDDMIEKYLKLSDTGNAMSFREVLNESVEEILKTGRIGLLVDFPSSGGDAYISTYIAESIINWEVDEFNDLISVVIFESVLGQGKDKFEKVVTEQYRHLFIEDEQYKIQIYNKNKQLSGAAIVPMVSGQPLKFIPMVILNSVGVSPALVKPPLLDIVDVNLSQYISSADLEHGRHFTGLPTPVVTGVSNETQLKIGSQTAWMITNDKAKATFLEFTGQGLASLEHAISEKTSQMAQFSTRLMDTSSRGSEAAETVRLRHSAEAATLSTIVASVESGLNIVYRWIAEFQTLEFTSLILNKDFLDTKLTHQELKELTESLIKGAIDQETYFYNLERGELVHPDKTEFDSSLDLDEDTNND